MVEFWKLMWLFYFGFNSWIETFHLECISDREEEDLITVTWSDVLQVQTFEFQNQSLKIKLNKIVFQIFINKCNFVSQEGGGGTTIFSKLPLSLCELYKQISN